MTSSTKPQITRAQTERLLAWMKQQQPRVYAGLVRRFTPASQVNGFWDSITGVASNVVNSVTNFFNSQGGQSLLTAAQPFIQTRLEKEQLQLNLQRMQSGLPPAPYPVQGVPYDPNNPSIYYPTGSNFPSSSPTGVQIPWMWLAGGGLGLGLLLSLSRGGSRR